MKLALLLFVGCGSTSQPEAVPFRVLTVNTGTTPSMGHDLPPDDGYDQVMADVTDELYGNGLSWSPAEQALAAWIATQAPDIVTMQELFWEGWCADFEADPELDLACRDWSVGAPVVVQRLLGDNYQIACHPSRPDKCAAVRKSFGRFEGCDQDLCLEGLAGAPVEGCGSGARVGRGVILLPEGEPITLVSIHGSSGLSAEEQACRRQQFEQAFVGLGGGLPAARGARNIVMGDFNTDPVLFESFDASARRLNEVTSEGFTRHTEAGEGAPRSYGDLADIDHVFSDAFTGSCEVGQATEAVYFDHHPVICTLTPQPGEKTKG